PGHYPVHILAEVMLTDDIDADFLAMIPQASWVVATEFVLGTFQMNVFNFKVRFVPQAAISPHCV
ncbi:MAG: hypothetical protein ACRCZC_00635, partial [Culicoidibacterales bacterium]